MAIPAGCRCITSSLPMAGGTRDLLPARCQFLKSSHELFIMKLQLTPELLKFLMGQGFKYCFSKTTLGNANDYVNITLTPARSRPNTRRLPVGYDTFFTMNREPLQMAQGIDGTLVMVEMNKETMISYIKAMLPLVDKHESPKKKDCI